MASLNLNNLNSSDSDAKMTENAPSKADVDLATGINHDPTNLSQVLEGDASACSAQGDSFGRSPEQDSVNALGVYSGPPRQGREGLQRAIDDFTTTELDGDLDHSTENEASFSYEGDHDLQGTYWGDNVSEDPKCELHSTLNYGIAVEQDPDAISHGWQEESYITGEEWSDERYRQAEQRFKLLENPSAEDKILFTKAQREEALRQQVLQSRLGNRKDLPEEDDGALSVEETDSPEASSSSHRPLVDARSRSMPKKATSKAKTPKISQRDKTKSMELGLRRLVGTNDYTTRLYNIKPTADQEKGKGNQRRSRKKTTRLTEKELESIFNPGDVIASAKTNAALPEIPTFTNADKSKALTELIASIPALSPEDQAAAKSDRLRILEATRKFDHKPSSDGKGLWKVKGLKTSLLHHQVLAVGWMRERERSSTYPLGGLLCDVMGFGKTVTALTNILDGRCTDEAAQRAPTLIVAPTGLLSHWTQQITKYCDPDVFGFTQVYEPSSGLSLQNEIKGILRSDVVLASYENVRRSYPTLSPPKGLESDKEIEEWWLRFYDQRVRVLHQIKWHRIVLDEGHAIKNPDSATSIAIRALTGTYKWVLSGTPLHNCVEELYPYFNFIRVPSCAALEGFERAFCDESHHAKKRLINILRSILHRKTHDSRLFSLPIIKLPKITQREEIVDFCEAEKILYDRIVQIFIESVNDLSIPGRKSQQLQCILTMFLKLRMFTSHLLTAQDLVQYALSDKILNELKLLDGKYDIKDNPSGQIVRMLLLAKFECSIPNDPTGPSEDEMTRTPPTGDRQKLISEFRDFMESLHEDERWQDRLDRLECPLCRHIPVQAIITSCKHMYCEECFHQLPDEEGRLGTETRICRGCMEPIAEAAHCGVFDKVNTDGYESSTSATSSPQGKRKREDKTKKSKYAKKPRTSSKGSQVSAMFNKYRYQTDEDRNENEADEDLVAGDWIPVIGENTPGAKLTRVHEIVEEWIKKDESVKIVLFTQFLDTIRLLKYMCAKEGWGYTTISGKMAPASRDQSIMKFREDKEMKIMISSLKTGGVGLDLSAANKCILMDLWWNEAIQEQAYCRLFRIGQKREVEFIKVVAKGTIDDKMLALQKEKTKNIQQVLSLNVLESRDTVKDILGFFGNVTTVEGGGFRVELNPGK